MPFAKKILTKYEINRVLFLLTASDVFTWVGYAILNILGGLYLENIFLENTIQYIGMGTAAFYLIKAITPIPFGKFLDNHISDVDEIVFISVGSFLIGISLMAYPLISGYKFYLFLQLVIGLGYAVNVSGWRKMFAKNIDTGKEGSEYGIYETVMSVAIGLIALLGGYLASINQDYFDYVFVGVGVLALFGGIMGLLILVVKDRKVFA